MHYVTFHSLKKVFIPTCSREIYLQTAFQRPASKSKLGRIFPLPVNLIHRYSGFCRILLSLKHMHQDYLNELLISQRLNHNTFSLVYSSNTNNSCSSHLFESTCYHYFKPTMKSFWWRNQFHSICSYPETMIIHFAAIIRHMLTIFL